MDKVLVAKDISKYYLSGSNIVKALDKVNIEISQGEFISIVGKLGSGKSTLLHILGGIDFPTEGKVFIDGEDIFSLKEEELAIIRRRKIGFIFQDYNLIESLNVWENIILSIGLDNAKVDKDYINEIINILGIEDKKLSLPNVLSGGEQQKVAIARALAYKPSIILADEPTGSLDSNNKIEVVTLLKSLCKKYCNTVIMTTHDKDIAQISDRVIFMSDGKVST